MDTTRWIVSFPQERIFVVAAVFVFLLFVLGGIRRCQWTVKILQTLKGVGRWNRNGARLLISECRDQTGQGRGGGRSRMGFRGSKNLGDMPSTRMFWLVIISPTQGQRRSNQRVLCRRSRLLLEKVAQSSDYADLAGRFDQPIGRSPRQTRTLRTGTDRVRTTRFGYHHHHRHGPRTEVDHVHQKREQLLFFSPSVQHT